MKWLVVIAALVVGCGYPHCQTACTCYADGWTGLLATPECSPEEQGAAEVSCHSQCRSQRNATRKEQV